MGELHWTHFFAFLDARHDKRQSFECAIVKLELFLPDTWRKSIQGGLNWAHLKVLTLNNMIECIDSLRRTSIIFIALFAFVRLKALSPYRLAFLF